jgi:FKBP-type peptidyl-prolyl cis-trans isomerase FklB
MKGIKIFALSALAVMAVAVVSCNRATPRTNLRTTVDTTSYALGVNFADPNIVHQLEHLGVFQNAMHLEMGFQSRIAMADSVEAIAIEREKRRALDSLHRANSVTINEFMRGMRRAIELDATSPYAIGISFGLHVAGQVSQLNEALFGADARESMNTNQILAGFADVLNNRQVFDQMEANQIFQSAMERAERVQFEEQIAEGAAFLAANAARAGVVTLPSGLQYKIVREGTGEKPTLANQVRVHYHGTLIDGTVFDSSMDRQREAPEEVDMSITFPVGGVIPGWVEALQLMPVGSKWKLFIPYDLGYGGQDRGIIPPFSVLIFEVELLDIE